jgi:hypothetical protein
VSIAGRSTATRASSAVAIERSTSLLPKGLTETFQLKTFAAAALAVLLGAQAGFSADQRQACSGILAHDDDGYMLIADPDSQSLWCAASFGEDEKSPLVMRVWKTCAIGSHCHIEGSFTGHGLFYWTRISSMSLLKR